MFFLFLICVCQIYAINLIYKLVYYLIHKLVVGSQVLAHSLVETGNGPNRPNTIDL